MVLGSRNAEMPATQTLIIRGQRVPMPVKAIFGEAEFCNLLCGGCYKIQPDYIIDCRTAF